MNATKPKLSVKQILAIVILVNMLFVLQSIPVTATVSPTTYLDDLPAASTYIGKTDGTNVWLVRYDGYKAWEGTDINVGIGWLVTNYNNWGLNLLEGTFPVKSALVFGTESNFKISGQGMSTKLQLQASLGTGVNIWNMTYTTTNQGFWTIRDLQFDSNALSYTSKDTIYISGGYRWLLDNIKILRPHEDGIYVTETGSAYPAYATVRNLQVYYAGRYGVYANGRDMNWDNIQVEYSYDSNFVFGTSANGNSLYRLHGTGAYNAGQIAYTSQRGGGQSRYAGLEIRSSGNLLYGLYLDRDNKYGIYLDGDNNYLTGRVYECNYAAGASGYSDIYVASGSERNRIVGFELNGQATNPTNYGVDDDNGGNWNAYSGNIAWDHAIANYTVTGANSKFDTGDNIG